ncbi:mitochondrial import inner membrane translocase subunit Tim9 B, putative [Pediculus humanus corporis]|uniref:Mitochondrial import inner membrane translocase subunit n=1 Tax=Pediculus humanus subsp. corporis TaxID=121224 RepID=E0VG39_PEDHC|nr:mitochondrial import inner membrane translocase subunit Tim9 B, putative [Pediculus humanus corporis]EEB12345.1 mitochondrial import inner membrane translocase subunit Tim9 B, putative [Pediculus humanus corporis]
MHCVNHLSDRDLSQDECGCVDMCTKKHVSVNHKVMQVYMEVQPEIINKRIEDMNKQQAAVEEAKNKNLEIDNKKKFIKDSNSNDNINNNNDKGNDVTNNNTNSNLTLKQ